MMYAILRDDKTPGPLTSERTCSSTRLPRRGVTAPYSHAPRGEATRTAHAERGEYGAITRELHRGSSHVDPHVDVRGAAEVPDEGRAFQPPNVPDAVVAQVLVLVERQRAAFQSAFVLQAGEHLLASVGR